MDDVGELEKYLLEGIRRTDPIDDGERLAILNIFDTQPKRKAAYLKQLGFESNPKDDNEYRPIGSQGNYAEIDASGLNQWIKDPMELLRDVGDIAYDVGEGFATTAAGVKGGVAGAAGGGLLGSAVPVVGNAVGAAAGGVFGFIAGSGLTKAASEQLKSAVGDIFLDESIPTDQKLVAAQAIFTGATPMILKGAGRVAKHAFVALATKRKDAIIRVAQKMGVGLNENLLNKVAANHEKYSEEVVDGANKNFLGLYREIVGDNATSAKGTRSITENSVFGKAVNPLNKEATAQEALLDSVSESSFKVKELLEPLIMFRKKLATKFKRDYEEESALTYLNKEIKYVMGKVSKSKSPLEENVSFKEGRQFLKAIQNDSNNLEVPGSSILKQVSGGGEYGLRSIADNKAEAAYKVLAARGTVVPQNLQFQNINKARTAIFKEFKNAREQLSPDNLKNAFLGDDGIKKQITKETLEGIDNTLGTDLSRRVDDISGQALIENLYKNPKSSGSRNIMTNVILGGSEGALKGGFTGAAAGLTVGQPTLGAGAGAIIGGAKGAYNMANLSTPQSVIKALSAADKNKIAMELYLSAPETFIEQISRTGVTEVLFDQLAKKPIESNLQTEEDDLESFLLKGIR